MTRFWLPALFFATPAFPCSMTPIAATAGDFGAVLDVVVKDSTLADAKVDSVELKGVSYVVHLSGTASCRSYRVTMNTACERHVKEEKVGGCK